MLGQGPIFGINESFGSQEKKFSISFSIANRKVFLSFNYNSYNSYLFVNGKEIFKFKTDNKNVNLPTQVCLGSIFNLFSAIECREVSLNGNVYDFLLNYSSIDKSDIISIQKYLMILNNIK